MKDWHVRNATNSFSMTPNRGQTTKILNIFFEFYDSHYLYDVHVNWM